jgi:ketosteroid isomerase-like protein
LRRSNRLKSAAQESKQTVQLTSFNKESVEIFTREFEQLFDANDAAAMTACYTKDGQIAADGVAQVQGHAAIQQFWQYAIDVATAAKARRTIHLQEASSSGDLAYALCTVKVDIPDANGTGAPTTITSWDTTVWRRDTDGVWRIVVDISVHLPLPTA